MRPALCCALLLAATLASAGSARAQTPPAVEPPALPALPPPSASPDPTAPAGGTWAPAEPPPGYPPGYAPPGPGYAPPPYYAPRSYYAPRYAAPVPPGPSTYVRQSPGALAGGIVSVALGAFGVATGIALLADGLSTTTSCGALVCVQQQKSPLEENLGWGALGLGGAAIGIGVRLIVFGGKKVPASFGDQALALVPAVQVTPARVGLTWAF